MEAAARQQVAQQRAARKKLKKYKKIKKIAQQRAAQGMTTPLS
jgi:hypothetical protein